MAGVLPLRRRGPERRGRRGRVRPHVQGPAGLRGAGPPPQGPRRGLPGVGQGLRGRRRGPGQDHRPEPLGQGHLRVHRHRHAPGRQPRLRPLPEVPAAHLRPASADRSGKRVGAAAHRAGRGAGARGRQLHGRGTRLDGRRLPGLVPTPQRAGPRGPGRGQAARHRKPRREPRHGHRRDRLQRRLDAAGAGVGRRGLGLRRRGRRAAPLPQRRPAEDVRAEGPLPGLRPECGHRGLPPRGPGADREGQRPVPLPDRAAGRRHRRDLQVLPQVVEGGRRRAPQRRQLRGGDGRGRRPGPGLRLLHGHGGDLPLVGPEERRDGGVHHHGHPGGQLPRRRGLEGIPRRQLQRRALRRRRPRPHRAVRARGVRLRRGGPQAAHLSGRHAREDLRGRGPLHRRLEEGLAGQVRVRQERLGRVHHGCEGPGPRRVQEQHRGALRRAAAQAARGLPRGRRGRRCPGRVHGDGVLPEGGYGRQRPHRRVRVPQRHVGLHGQGSP
mmetsp:Transcript_61428/g.180222  ORF Transcript_61428/g.180222 Transcript_61428/m.180222 type:complete len:496 (+) Transcript_61428:620-2107(+)